MESSILISGYYGFDNLGDEAILYSIINLLRKKRNDLEIIVISQRPEITAKRYGVKSIDRRDLVEIIKALRESRLFISGGGSLLQDITGIYSIPYYLGLVFLAQIMGNKTVFYAQGIGPLHKKISRFLVRWISNRTDLITIRDSDSAELLRKIGVKIELIEKTVDPVYGIKNFSKKSKNDLPQIVAEFLDEENIDYIDDKIIGLSVRPWDDNDYLDAVARAGDYLKEKTGGKLIILPMYFDDDLVACKKVREKMESAVSLFKRQAGPGEMVSFFSIFDFFLGVRLHSLIFAAVNRVPFVGISYDPKVDSLLSDLGVETGLSTENCNFADLKNIIDDFWENRESITEKLDKKMSSYSIEAEDNAEKILQLLDKVSS